MPPLPDIDQLLRFEHLARRHGTGLKPEDMAGCWRLQQVWGKGSGRPSAPAAALLRALGARLEIAAGPGQEGLRLTNGVSLGAMELRFEGQGHLRGRRPLLVFWFTSMQLRLGSLTLLQRSLPRPAERRLPFFALIAREAGSAGEPGWLAARGRSGGLAVWTLAASPAPEPTP
jgi:hypothetical protein